MRTRVRRFLRELMALPEVPVLTGGSKKGVHWTEVKRVKKGSSGYKKALLNSVIEEFFLSERELDEVKDVIAGR